MKSIKISESAYQALKAEAKKRGCFLSWLIAEALNNYLKKPPKNGKRKENTHAE
jgi:hypothetical protein